jgi:gliding motility-associated-like protein
MKKFFTLLFFLVSNFVFSQVNLTSGLAAYYPFNGHTADMSGNGNHILTNLATPTAGASGLPNTAYYFNGGTSYMVIPNSPSLNPQEFSLCAKVKVLGFSQGSCFTNTILNKGSVDGEPGNYALRFTSNAYTGSCGVNDSIHQNFTGLSSTNPQPGSYSPYIEKGVWYAVVYTFGPDSIKLYVDGILKSKAKKTVDVGVNSKSITLGTRFDPMSPYWFTGIMDEVRIYNRSLNTEEVKEFSKPESIIEGVINQYTPVVSFGACNNSLTVEDGTAFNAGDTVLLIQMKGAVVDSSNSASFGTVANYRNAGNYEFNYVKSRAGNVVELKNVINRQYDVPAGKVQLVRVPYYQDVTVSSTLTCLPWDGRKGGILVLNVRNTLTLNADLDVSEKGFRGGQPLFNSTVHCNKTDYYYPPTLGEGGQKGEGIAEVSTSRLYGRGALSNGGGGGNSHNSGGAGGGNGGQGGTGGNQYPLAACPVIIPVTGGVSGKQLPYSVAANKVYLGGGGGAGHANDGTDKPGGNGGGIIFVIANTIAGNGRFVKANGGNVVECTAATFSCANDGHSAGGAGGTVLMSANTYTGSLTVTANGGKGADAWILPGSVVSTGPGGGGGGGVIWYKQASSPSASTNFVNGGPNGIAKQSPVPNDPWGSTPGANGTVLSGLVLDFSNAPFRPNIDSVRIKESATSCSSFSFKGLAFTNTAAIANWQWTFGDGGQANTQNTSHTYTTSGTFTVKLVVTDVNGCKDSVSKTVSTSSSNIDFTYKQDICNPLRVEFTSLTPTSSPAYWSFGDGNTSGADNPTHTFGSYGNYIIKHTRVSSACRDTAVKIISLAVTNENIVITPDTTICAGSTKLLRSVQALSFCWTPSTFLDNPALQNPITSTPQDITYYLTSETTGQNIIVNGDFSSGNTGFTSSYQYSPSSGFNPGVYNVGSNIQAWHSGMQGCVDHTTGAGNMMMVNGSSDLNVNVWSQTVTVQPNTNYAFSTWLQHITSLNPARLQFSINGRQIGNEFMANSTSCIWENFYATWNSGTNTTATISIINKNIVFSGNDFALDDISFAPIFIKRDSVRITVNKPLVRTIRDSTSCEGSQIQLTTTGATTYSWSPTMGLSNPSIPNPIATLTGNITYYVSGTNSFGCVGKDTVNLTSVAAPTVTTSNDTGICGNRTIPIFATGGTTYSWTPTATLSDPNVSNPLATPTSTTTYYVTVTNAAGCSKSDSVTITVNNLPVISKSNDTAACINSNVQLFASGGTSYSWSPASTLNNPNIANPIATPTGSTTYYVTVSNGVGCSKTDSVRITGIATPVVTKSNDTAICQNRSAQLFATGGTSYSWTPAAGLDNPNISNPVSTPTATTTYYVTVRNSAGCSKQDSVRVTVNSAPIITRSSDTTICNSSSVQLFATGGTTYSWSPATSLNNPNIYNPIATPATTTLYYVDVTNASGCSKRDSVKISVTSSLAITKSNDTTLCEGKSAQLLATGGTIYSWTPATGLDNPNISNPIASPAATTMYRVTVSNTSGCSKTDSVRVTVNAAPVITKSRDTSICDSSSRQIFATGGVSYAWTPASTLSDASVSNPIASPTSTTTYYVTVTNVAGCSKIDSVKIAVSGPPTVTISADTAICLKTAARLHASGGTEYTWSPAASLNNPNISNPLASPSSNTTYYVIVKNAEGCANIDSVEVVTKPLPNLRASKSNDISCSVNAAQLNVSGGISYSWTPSIGLNNSAIRNPIATPSNTTTYWVIGKDTSGCTNADSVTINVQFVGKGQFLMPNSFTPNGDGVNDCFGIKSWGPVQELEFSVFNRFGERVFHTTKPTECWDGTHKKATQGVNVFVYMIKAKATCGSIERKGTVTLLR